MEDLNTIETIARVIQLAVAPVFLLAGIAGLLNVLSTRLGRVVDRVRIVETRLAKEPHEEHRVLFRTETKALWQRIRLVNWSLRMFVAAALLICGVIMSLFVSEVSRFNLSTAISSLFVSAMALLIMGLILFLIEVSVSTRSIRDGIVHMLADEEPSAHKK